MELTILGATGRTGRELVRQALERGHRVTAVAREPAKLDDPRVRGVAGDVREPQSMTRALAGASVVVSALGVTSGESAGVLTAGARALIDAAPGRIVWLGAYGAGPSAAAAGWATRTLLKAMGARLDDKVAADALILAAGGTVFHAGPLSDGPLSSARRTIGLSGAPRRFFPARVSRATVAAAMLDEAESPQFPGGVGLPLTR